MTKLSDWLSIKLDEKGWSMRELGRRAGVSHAQISNVINGSANPGADFCLAVAHAFGERPEEVMRLGGLLPPRPPEVEEEEEVVDIIRRLPTQARETAIRMLRALDDRSFSVSSSTTTVPYGRLKNEDVMAALDRLPAPLQEKVLELVEQMVQEQETELQRVQTSE